MLVLMGMVMVCLVADEYGDPQQLLIQTTSSTCTAVVADDFDLDDDDDEAVNISFVENKAWACSVTSTTPCERMDAWATASA